MASKRGGRTAPNKTRDLKVLWRLTPALWGVGGHWAQGHLSEGNRDSVAAALAKMGVVPGFKCQDELCALGHRGKGKHVALKARPKPLDDEFCPHHSAFLKKKGRPLTLRLRGERHRSPPSRAPGAQPAPTPADKWYVTEKPHSRDSCNC